jgi:hypothetical protein
VKVGVFQGGGTGINVNFQSPVYCFWFSPAQSSLVLGPVRTHYHILLFFFLQTITYFETRPPLLPQEGPDCYGSLPLYWEETLLAITFTHSITDSLTYKWLLALASIVILGSESHGTNDHILLSDGSGSLQTLALTPSDFIIYFN